jgi:hypothetical protein
VLFDFSKKKFYSFIKGETMKNIFLLLITCGFLFGGCTEEIIEIDEENFQDNSYKIVECHNEQNWTEEDLEDAITGKWTYVIGWCGWTGLITPDFDKQTIKIEDDGTAIIKTDDEEESTTWEIINYRTMSVHIENLGNFYVCGDKITSYASPTDGCDLTFSK